MKRNIIVTGIGSRETPPEILRAMEYVGQYVARSGGWVRSGHADGADWAFEKGAESKTIAYIPWKGFNATKPFLGTSKVITDRESPRLSELVGRYHPAPSNLSEGGYKLMLRNGAQVLGVNSDQPSDVIVAYTEETGKGQFKGGTGQALRIAYNYRIPIINMWLDKYKTAEAVIEKLKEIWKTKIADTDIQFVLRDRPIYGWMSNFTRIPVLWEHSALGYQEWPSSEHAYQAAKTDDPDRAEEIRLARTPAKSRDLGQAFPRIENLVEVMTEIVTAKFTNPALQTMLLETGDRKLIEDAPWDEFWGWGKNQDGQNHLGKLLMQLREDLRSSVSSS